MKRFYEIQLTLIIISIFSIIHGAKPAAARRANPPTAQYVVLIDTTAADRFHKNNAIMQYAYTVTPKSGESAPSAEGEGTFNFKNALEHHCSSLSAFSQIQGDKMPEIMLLPTSTITVNDTVYTPSSSAAIQITAQGYPYIIMYDKTKDQFQILDSNKAVATTFTTTKK